MARAQIIKINCPKCDGRGRIAAFGHVQGGVCFSCGGTGVGIRSSASKPSKSFAIGFLWTDPADVNYRDGQFCPCFTIKARSRAEAEKKAAAAMSRNGSSAFSVTEI